VKRPSLNGYRARRAEEAFASLPETFLGAEHAIRGIYRVELTDLDRAWEIELTEDSCEVADEPGRKPDTEITTDSATWLALRDGKLSGLDAFVNGRLSARGNMDLALALESMFRIPGNRPPKVKIYDVEAGDNRINTLSSGTGERTVILLHGLGGAKSSFFRTVAELSRDHTVHAIDFPGFGASSKPAAASYSAEWMAGTVLEFMDAMEIRDAHLVGNSMGGRVAVELGLLAPERVTSLSLLAPALAWLRNRPLLRIVRLLRPELAAIPHPLLARLVRVQVRGLFAHPDEIDPAILDLATEDFLRLYRSRNARIAFYAAARNIYLDAPFGVEGMWTRLAELRPPALFVWGDSDGLVPAGFERHVARVLPDARQVLLEDCGHVPQIEEPDRTHALIRSQISSSADLGSSTRWPIRAAS